MRILNSLSAGLIGLVASAAVLHAGERPTLVHTNDPRPDILPHPFYENHTEYRARYNRPRFIGGWIAYNVSRTSQEAMSWKENYCAGNYDKHHMPPMYKTYYYPKPWEVLLTGARPDFANAKAKTLSNPASAIEQIAIPDEEGTPVDEKGSSSRKRTNSRQQSAGTESAAVVEMAKEVVPSPSDR